MPEFSTEVDGRVLPEGHVLAGEIREGMFLTGMDNGCVVDVSGPTDNGGDVTLTFHTYDGEEATLTCPAYMPVMAGKQSR